MACCCLACAGTLRQWLTAKPPETSNVVRRISWAVLQDPGWQKAQSTQEKRQLLQLIMAHALCMEAVMRDSQIGALPCKWEVAEQMGLCALITQGERLHCIKVQ